jgi:hypothetical protein
LAGTLGARALRAPALLGYRYAMPLHRERPRMNRTLTALLLGAGLLAGCAEMRTPVATSRIPAGLGVVAADPLPTMAAEAAAAFADGGRSLAGRPEVTARAVGQGEILGAELRRDPRWAALPTAVGSELRTARLEWRAALGIRAGAAPEAVGAALGRAAIALAAGDTRGGAAALDPALFEPGGTPNLARLAAPGPLPTARSAAGLAEREMARLARQRGGGLSNALDPDAGLVGLGQANAPPAGMGTLRGL